MIMARSAISVKFDRLDSPGGWLKTTEKTPKYAENRYDEGIVFLRALRPWIAQHGKASMVYFDESGFASHAHRPHGWAIRGR
jgi:hypothetical protein